jgi:hypothetical protein
VRAPVTEPEARRVRAAMDSAEVAAVIGALRAAPRGTWRAVTGALRAAFDVDGEDRSPLERLVDGLLDAAADAPADLRVRLCDAFDRAMHGAGESDA